MATNNYAGYLMKIGNVTFNNPSPLKDTWKVAPALVQVGVSQVLASGKLSIKVLPHDRVKIWVEFPVMTYEQFQTYWKALHSDSGGHGMYLNVQYYDESSGTYKTDTFYHNDLTYTVGYYGKQRMVKMDAFDLIGH